MTMSNGTIGYQPTTGTIQASNRQAFDAAVPASPLRTLATVFDDANVVISRLETLADRLCGPTPTNAGSSDEVAGPGALFPALQQDALRLGHRLADAHAALARIEEAVS